MERKLCLACGRPSLETDTACWACGSRRFANPGVADPGEVTLADDGADFPTQIGLRQSRSTTALAWLGAAVAVAVIAGTTGFLAGRLQSTRTPEPEPSARPGLTHTSPPPAPNPPLPPVAPPISMDPQVTIRPYASPAVPPPPHPPDETGPTAARPNLSIRFEPAGVGDPPPGNSPPAGGSSDKVAASLQPSDTHALLTVRNGADAVVELNLDGPAPLHASIGAGSVFPLQLVPGTYRIRATAGSLKSPESSLTVTARESPVLVIQQRSEGEPPGLVLIEREP